MDRLDEILITLPADTRSTAKDLINEALENPTEGALAILVKWAYNRGKK